jgi:hypothetical protein
VFQKGAAGWGDAFYALKVGYVAAWSLALAVLYESAVPLGTPPLHGNFWKIGKSLWITAFSCLESSTYDVPIVHCTIGKFSENLDSV